MRKLDAADRRHQPQERQAAAARPSPGVRTSWATRKCAELPQAGGAFWKKTVHASAWRTLVERRQGERLQVRRLPRHRLRRGRRHPASATRATCATCSARSATGPDRPTSPRRGTEEPLARPQGHAGQHLHRLPHRAALRHLPVRGLPARHDRRRSRRERAQEAGRRPDGPRAAHRRAGAREAGGRKAEEGPDSERVPRPRSAPTAKPVTPDAAVTTPARRSAAGPAGRARCCRR